MDFALCCGSSLPQIWAVEALACSKDVEPSLLLDLLRETPNISKNIGKNARELVSLKILERLFIQGGLANPESSALSKTVRLDSSDHCEDVLRRILNETSLSHKGPAETDISKWDLEPFIEHKRSTLPRCALEQLKDVIISGSLSISTSLREKSGLLSHADHQAPAKDGSSNGITPRVEESDINDGNLLPTDLSDEGERCGVETNEYASSGLGVPSEVLPCGKQVLLHRDTEVNKKSEKQQRQDRNIEDPDLRKTNEDVNRFEPYSKNSDEVEENVHVADDNDGNDDGMTNISRKEDAPVSPQFTNNRNSLETLNSRDQIVLPDTSKRYSEGRCRIEEENCPEEKSEDQAVRKQERKKHSVGKPAPANSLDLKASAFDPREKLWTKFPPEGSKNTPPHQSCEFKWKDYFPLVFRALRKIFNVDPANYMMSMCGSNALRQLSSPGKSGSLFYLTNDDKYMIKTIKKSEVKMLKRMLPAYYNHVWCHENTLLTRFVGLHCVKMTGPAQKKVRFVIMGNLFDTEYTIHRRFDLKGSSHGRSTVKHESEIDSSTTLKDLDLNLMFRLQKPRFQEFFRQVNKDCEFLEHEKIMDYSLLVGINFRQVSHSGEPLTSNGDKESEVVAPLRLGSNMPARAELTAGRNSNGVGETASGECYDVILVLGIIDILQDYDISKKLEHAYKSFHHDPTSISAIDPRHYSKRFLDFIFTVFTQDSSTPSAGC